MPVPSKAPAPAAKAPATAPRVPEGTPGALGLAWWLWGVVALVVVALGAIAWRWLLRPRSAIDGADAAVRPATDLDDALAKKHAATESMTLPPAPAAREHRVIAESDADLATSVPGADPVTLRRRYIEERFPEIASGTIAPTTRTRC